MQETTDSPARLTAYNTRIQRLIDHVTEAAASLTTSCQTVNAAANAASGSTEHVVLAIEQVSQGATHTAGNLEEANGHTALVLKQVVAIHSEVSATLTEAQSASDLAATGHQRVARSRATAEGVRQTVSRSSAVMAELEEQVQQIGSIIEIIKSIASQTNLLALNAAIEAARAGDAGRGFGVVANEVRSLATRAREWSEGIERLVAETRSRTAAAVTLMGEVERETAAGAQVASASEGAFEEISAAVRRLSTRVTAIGTAAESATAAARQVTIAVENVAAVAEHPRRAGASAIVSGKTAGERVHLSHGAHETEAPWIRLPRGASMARHLVPRRGPLVSVCLGLVATLACGRSPTRDKHPDPSTRMDARHSAPVALLRAPPDSEIPDGPLGVSIQRGRALLIATRDSLPQYVGNRLRCVSCHLDNGLRVNSSPWVGVYGRFPQYRSRSGTVQVLEDRINDCFQRSMNGRALPLASREMHDMMAYFAFLSRDVPVGRDVPGQGFAKMTPLPADTVRGAEVFAASCARCHGANGEGTAAGPPVWGSGSYNIGAGMARVRTAASFIRYNMPHDTPGSLTDQQAFDVAAYINSRPRPDFPGKEKDWPNGDPPPDVAYRTLAGAKKGGTPSQGASKP